MFGGFANQAKQGTSMSRPAHRLKEMSLEDVPRGVSLLAVAVFRLSRTLKSAVTRIVSRDGDIGLVAWRVLVGLSLVPDATQKELVAFTRTEQAQLSKVLKEMDLRGLIRSAADQGDRRAKVFRLSEAGRRKYRALLPDVTQLTDAMDAALTPKERQQFLSMCGRIAEASQQAGGDRPSSASRNDMSRSTIKMEATRGQQAPN